MNEDFSNINLYRKERFKLFCMRFRKCVSDKFLGESLYGLSRIKFIQAVYEFEDAVATQHPKETFYQLTDRYFRYCVYRRNKFYDGKIWPFIISIATSVITAIISSYKDLSFFLLMFLTLLSDQVVLVSRICLYSLRARHK